MTPEQLLREVIDRLDKLEQSDRYTFEKHIQVLDGRNIFVGRGTGTKIGSETGQKLGFFSATPVIQPATTGQLAGHSAVGGNNVSHQDTFTGGSGTAFTLGDIVKHLKDLGLLKA
jgi:hypothetical protein